MVWGDPSAAEGFQVLRKMGLLCHLVGQILNPISLSVSSDGEEESRKEK